MVDAGPAGVFTGFAIARFPRVSGYVLDVSVPLFSDICPCGVIGFVTVANFDEQIVVFRRGSAAARRDVGICGIEWSH